MPRCPQLEGNQGDVQLSQHGVNINIQTNYGRQIVFARLHPQRGQLIETHFPYNTIKWICWRSKNVLVTLKEALEDR